MPPALQIHHGTQPPPRKRARNENLSARLTAVFTRVFLWLRADMYRTLQDWRTWESIKAELKAIERRERATKIGVRSEPFCILPDYLSGRCRDRANRAFAGRALVSRSRRAQTDRVAFRRRAVDRTRGISLAAHGQFAIAVRPLKLDAYIYQFDRLFGSPSFHLGQLVAVHLWLRTLVSVSYGLLPMAMLGAFAATLLLRPEREAIRVAQTFLLNLFAALRSICSFPYAARRSQFPSFPALPTAGLVPHLLAISAAPNGVPSVHMSSALLVLWFLRRWNWAAPSAASTPR